MRGKAVSIKYQRAKYVATDWLTSFIGFFVFDLFRYWMFGKASGGNSLWEYLFSGKILLEQCIAPVVMLGVFWLSGYYNHPFGKSRLSELSNTIFASLTNTALIMLSLLINDRLYTHTGNYELIFLLFFSLFFFTYCGRLFITQNAIRHFKDRKWGFDTVIVGASDVAMQAVNRLRNSQMTLGYNVIAHIPLPGETQSKENHTTIRREQLDKMCADRLVDQILIVPETQDEKKLLLLLYNLLPLNIPIRIAPSASAILSSKVRLQDVYGEPFVDLTSPVAGEFSKNFKRLMDVVVSGLALLILSPFLAAIAIAIKLTSKGPVFYAQERIGYHQKPFKIYKFRSMVHNAEPDGPRLSDDDDPRITPLGHFMRKYRIDELPQFWNVLKGDMSLVGPRPERAFFIRQIMKEAPYYSLVHQVRPGLTSWGMVKFGYAKTVSEMVERTRYDLIYLQNMSITMDLKIILHTINTVFSGKGV